MSEYKLVPVEPTPEWVANLRKIRIDRMESVIEDVLAAAPDVQGEPVAWMTTGDFRSATVSSAVLADWKSQGLEVAPLYTAPQPAEEIGEVVVTKDKIGNIVSVTRQDAEGRVLSVIAESDGCDGDCDAAEQQREPCHEYGGNGAGGEHEDDCSQQSAPDVPGLTDALRQYQHNDGSGLVFGYDKLLVDRYVAGLVDALEALLDVRVVEADASYGLACAKAEHALAAHRKGGGHGR